MLRCRNRGVWAKRGRGSVGPTCRQRSHLCSQLRTAPSKREGKRNTKINCMPCPKYQRPSSPQCSSCASSGQDEHCTPLPLSVCTDLQNQLRNTRSMHAATVRGSAPPMAATHAPDFAACTEHAARAASCRGHMLLAGLQSGQPEGSPRLGSSRKL